jgi:hypothetical protein
MSKLKNAQISKGIKQMMALRVIRVKIVPWTHLALAQTSPCPGPV